jgi:hypothetical protein
MLDGAIVDNVLSGFRVQKAAEDGDKRNEHDAYASVKDEECEVMHERFFLRECEVFFH